MRPERPHPPVLPPKRTEVLRPLGGRGIATNKAGPSPSSYIERSGTGLQESLEYVRLLLGQLGILSGVPDYVFGIQLGRPKMRQKTGAVCRSGKGERLQEGP